MISARFIDYTDTGWPAGTPMVEESQNNAIIDYTKEKQFEQELIEEIGDFSWISLPT